MCNFWGETKQALFIKDRFFYTIHILINETFPADFPDVFKNREGRVVNGFDTGQALPYQLQLVFGDQQQHFCGATLVTEKYATSAYHCFAIQKYQDEKINQVYLDLVTVKAGQYNKDNSYYSQVSCGI